MSLPRYFFVLLLVFVVTEHAQTFDPVRFRELREKTRSGTLTSEEKSELDAIMKARTGGDGTQSREEMRKKRMEEYEERQEFVFERSRQFQKDALAAAAARKAPSGPAREYFVNNVTSDDNAGGMSGDKAVKSLAKAVSLLQPGDTLHLAVTSQPYRESLRLGDDFCGVEGKPITIEGHGATLTGSDPLRLDGWVEAEEPGLYKSARFFDRVGGVRRRCEAHAHVFHLRRRGR